MTEKLGATGRYPDGSLGADDEGELAMRMARDERGYVHIDFGKPVTWFALPREQAIEFAKLMLKHCGIEMTPVKVKRKED